MRLALATVNILIEMNLAFNSILDVFSKTLTKVHYVFQIMEILFHYILMWLFRVYLKPIHNLHYLYNIRFCAYHYIHDISNNFLKCDNLHYFQVYNTLNVTTPLWGKCEVTTHTSENGTWESSGTFENLEIDCKGQNTLH
jgi:hypothetical protein